MSSSIKNIHAKSGFQLQRLKSLVNRTDNFSAFLRSWIFYSTKPQLSETFFFSSESSFDLAGFFSPAFIIPTEKDFNLLSEIVCKEYIHCKALLWRWNVDILNSKSIAKQNERTDVKFQLTFIDPGVNPSGVKPHGRFFSGSDFFPAITCWIVVENRPDVLCSKRWLRMTEATNTFTKQ